MGIKDISVLIITKNEEKQILTCLKSVSDFSDVVVLDTGSTDSTVSIAKKTGVKTVSYLDGKNFSEWRNKAFSYANGEWVFYLDADEEVPVPLKEELLNISSTNDQTYSAYAVPRLNKILGRTMKHGGWYPDYQKRFFKKNKFKKFSGDLHEEPKFDGELGHIKNYLIHHKQETFFEMVEKTNRWSEIEAKLMYDAKHPPMNLLRFFTAVFREFWYRMIVKMAFLDGVFGIAIALYQVFSRFVSYAKLWEMQTNKK